MGEKQDHVTFFLAEQGDEAGCCVTNSSKPESMNLEISN